MNEPNSRDLNEDVGLDSAGLKALDPAICNRQPATCNRQPASRCL